MSKFQHDVMLKIVKIIDLVMHLFDQKCEKSLTLKTNF